MATSSGQLSALAKCQSAILRWMLKVVSLCTIAKDDPALSLPCRCSGLRRSRVPGVGPEDGPAVGDDGFGRAVTLHDGLITKQKFCFTRCGSLVLSLPRSQASRPPNKHRNSDSSQAYPPREAAQCGGTHETPVESLQTDNTAPGCKPTLGSSLPEHPAMDSAERTQL